MLAQEAVDRRLIGGSWSVVLLWLSYALVVVVAILPRVHDLGVFVTEDEVNFWFERSQVFLNALHSGTYAATAITDHPGVTTMWLGAAGLMLHDWGYDTGWLQGTTVQTDMAVLRLPLALTHGVAVVVGYALARRVFDPRVALVGALLWALDPFVIAYSRLLHVDALAGTFATLSVLAAICAWYDRSHRMMVLVSAACAALAMLSKSPAVMVVPIVVGIALHAVWTDRARRSLRWGLSSLVVWCSTVATVALLAWPALWAAPGEAYYQLRLGVVGEGARPHQLGNYFLGRATAVPDWRFYLVALVLRLTPVSLVGLIAAPWAFRSLRSRMSRAGFVWLLLYACGFLFAMSVFPKKFNRYLVPAFPAFDLVAAVGLVGAARLVGHHLTRVIRSWSAMSVQSAVLAIAIVLALFNVALWHPYEISAFNQVFGGARTGVWAFGVGWGEGLEQAAAWLNQQPDIGGVLTVTTMKPGLQTYLRAGAQAASPPGPTLPAQSGYVVIYRQQAQTGVVGPPFDAFWGRVPPLHIVSVHGVEYAWIYQAPPSVAQRNYAQFGSAVALYGVTPQFEAAARSLQITLIWQPHDLAPQNTMLFAHLIGPDGKRYAQADLVYPPRTWQPGRYTHVGFPLAVPEQAPAGQYQLVIGMYDPTTGQRLPLTSADRAPAVVDGPDALPLSVINLP